MNKVAVMFASALLGGIMLLASCVGASSEA